MDTCDNKLLDCFMFLFISNTQTKDVFLFRNVRACLGRKRERASQVQVRACFLCKVEESIHNGTCIELTKTQTKVVLLFLFLILSLFLFRNRLQTAKPKVAYSLKKTSRIADMMT